MPPPTASSHRGVPARYSSLIAEYYKAFNERRFVDAAALFAHDAVLEQLPGVRQERGGIGYLQFVSAWLNAFPDAVMAVRQISTPSEGTTFEVTVDGTGTHTGALDLGGWVFRPTGEQVKLGFREVLEIHEDKFTFSSLTFNLHEIVDSLAQVDASKLLKHLERLRELADAMRALTPDSVRARELTAEIGRELDAARHVVRPYYRGR